MDLSWFTLNVSDYNLSIFLGGKKPVPLGLDWKGRYVKWPSQLLLTTFTHYNLESQNNVNRLRCFFFPRGWIS